MKCLDQAPREGTAPHADMIFVSRDGVSGKVLVGLRSLHGDLAFILLGESDALELAEELADIVLQRQEAERQRAAE